jgi:ankyrin repeat protein
MKSISQPFIPIPRQSAVAGAYPDLPDKHGMTPLMYSVQVEWRNLVELFLGAGAQVNWQEKKGRTALHIGAETEDHR